ncbi:MAG: radical SAM protein [Candidatus Aminicenantes bacterium]|nr:radical SAM protein [Candidatus Aminicenantes bacterium]NIM85138.1 radical SAM protein [Candidatus Aminicenantes bacterium]NIN24648.1 radical SAM protein [Candidatus Aminicenantes bacterium]NIN48409.1 radical SAM protein [Candidatus Aminicenantes bacterium]NIN91312.1 radical SAM protein [Candidatus Aminicenantes bacterium]
MKVLTGEVLAANTWTCNLRCSYCFVRKTDKMKEDEFMSPETAVRVIDALDEGLSEINRIRVHLYGGEPFINLPAIEAMVKRAGDKKPGRIGFVVTTNGTILSDAVIDLLEAGKFDIVLSIDGPAEVHDACRKRVDGSPTHRDVMRFLETVRSRTSCYVTGAAVIRSGWRLLYASEYLRTLPIDNVKAQAVRLAAGTPYALTEEDMKLYQQDLEAIGRQVIKELEAEKVPMDRRFAGRVMKLLIKGEGLMRYCDAGKSNLGITPSGVVKACLLVDEEDAVLGHVNDDVEVWKQAGLKWQERPLRKKCTSCSYLQLCGGGCPAVVPVCGDEECKIVHKECDVANVIYEHFSDKQENLLGLVGIV